MSIRSNVEQQQCADKSAPRHLTYDFTGTQGPTNQSVHEHLRQATARSMNRAGADKSTPGRITDPSGLARADKSAPGHLTHLTGLALADKSTLGHLTDPSQASQGTTN